MQLRVVGDQPWDVSADVLVVPLVGEPTFDGALAELDKRAGGELSALAAFGELKEDRYSTVVTAAGELPAGRLLVACVGEAETITRQVIVRIGSAVERRLAGRQFASCRHDSAVAVSLEFTKCRQRREFATGPLV